MHTDTPFFTMFIIFSGAAVLSTVVLYTRQSLLVAYMLLGAAFGPWGLRWITDATTLKQVGDVGIIFLLFLLGLHLQPQNLLHMLRKVTSLAIISSIAFAAIGQSLPMLYHREVLSSPTILKHQGAHFVKYDSTLVSPK